MRLPSINVKVLVGENYVNRFNFHDRSYDVIPQVRGSERMKQTSLWMKKNKVEIRAFIKGMILIEPNAGKRIASKAFAIMFGKFWGYPLLVTASQEEALETAQRLLKD